MFGASYHMSSQSQLTSHILILMQLGFLFEVLVRVPGLPDWQRTNAKPTLLTVRFLFTVNAFRAHASVGKNVCCPFCRCVAELSVPLVECAPSPGKVAGSWGKGQAGARSSQRKTACP